MLTQLYSIELQGMHGIPIEVEIHVGRGKPAMHIIGLPDTAISEAQFRVRTALKNADLGFPYDKVIVINLAPADIPKEGSSYDMAMCVGILFSALSLSASCDDSVFVGEVSLDGTFRHVKGVLTLLDAARAEGFAHAFIPAEDVAEAALVQGITVYPVRDIRELFAHLLGKELITPLEPQRVQPQAAPTLYDMAAIKGQVQARRALEVAAAGSHNILLQGPPGSGKTLLAKTITSILPPLEESELLEVMKVYSVANKLQAHSRQILHRPFRAPHHTSSAVSLIGGGRIPQPGEITLAHRGILFLDEFPEFPRIALETLRQPLEDGVVTISRVESSLTFPAQFMLVAAMNPCPCGYYGDTDRSCNCSDYRREQYHAKLSGPLIDRIDVRVQVPRIPIKELYVDERAESSAVIRERVMRARALQTARFQQSATTANAYMTPQEIEQHCVIDDACVRILEQAAMQLHLSGRSYTRLLKVARTIADLEGSERIEQRHLLEALQYRK